MVTQAMILGVETLPQAKSVVGRFASVDNDFVIQMMGLHGDYDEELDKFLERVRGRANRELQRHGTDMEILLCKKQWR
eukprot:4925118-Karenia_brevis.AAC.1